MYMLVRNIFEIKKV